MSKWTDVLKDVGLGGGFIEASVRVVEKIAESENKEATSDQKSEEDIYSIKNETDIDTLREKHRLKMEAERERERREREREEKEEKERNKAGKGLLIMFGFLGGALLLVGPTTWLEENGHTYLMIAYPVAVLIVYFVCAITAIVLWHKRAMRQHDIEVLKTNIGTIGESEAERRAKKYQDK